MNIENKSIISKGKKCMKKAMNMDIKQIEPKPERKKRVMWDSETYRNSLLSMQWKEVEVIHTLLTMDAIVK